AQFRKQLYKPQTDLARLAQVVPRQFAQGRATQLEDQGAGRARLPAFPRRPIALLVLCPEGDAVLEWQYIETAFAQARQDLLIQQHVVRVCNNPQPGEIGGEFFQDAISPCGHACAPPDWPTLNISTALRSGVQASASASAAKRVSCSTSSRLRRCSLTAGRPMRPIAW